MLKSLIAGAKTSNKAIWNIAYSIMLGNLAQTIIAFTDTAFLGQLGEVELGAAAMSGIYYFFFTTLAWGFSIGVQIIIARRLGEGQIDKIVSTLLHGFVFILFFGSALFGVIHFLSPTFLRAVLSSDNVYNVSMDFLSYRAYGIFFASLNFMYRSFYIGLSKTRSISYSTVIMALVNIFLDWALIFGTPFNSPMGVQGAALASVAAEVSATIFFTIYTMVTHPVQGHRVFRRFKFEMENIRGVLKLSLPTMMQKMVSYGLWLYFFFMVESMGERELAVTMVLRNIFMMISIPAFAFGAASNTITSRLIGEGREDEVVPTVYKVIRMSLIITAPLLLLIIFAPAFWVSLITNSQAIVEAAVPICYLLCVTVLTFCVGMAFFEAVSGTGYTQKAFYIEIAALVLYALVIWYTVSVAQAPLIYVWSSEIIYSGMMCVLTILFMKHYNWRKRNM
ncbi:MAG: MATE family efflux transporter [Rikenellaceae bacterium]